MHICLQRSVNVYNAGNSLTFIISSSVIDSVNNLAGRGKNDYGCLSLACLIIIDTIIAYYVYLSS